MFDLGLGKLLIITTVALVVIGPERIPTVAKTIGVLIGRFQRYFAGIKNELQSEIALNDFSKMEAAFHAAQKEIEESLTISTNNITPHAIRPSPARSTPSSDEEYPGKQLRLFQDIPVSSIPREHLDRR